MESKYKKFALLSFTAVGALTLGVVSGTEICMAAAGAKNTDGQV